MWPEIEDTLVSRNLRRSGIRPGDGRMRIVVVGTSGVGKTTLARRIAGLFELPHIELDAINWQSGWHDLTRHAPEAFVRRVNEGLKAVAWWVGGHSPSDWASLWPRAT